MDSFKEKISQKYKINTAIIEDCFLSFFKTKGKRVATNVTTLKALARYGILIYDRFKRLSEEIRYVMPTESRKVIGFSKSDKKVKNYKLKQEVVDYVNNLLDLELKMKDNDIADAIVLALCGLIYEEK